MENTGKVSEGIRMESENVHGGRGIEVNYRVFMAFLLLLALGGSVFPLVYAWGPHEALRRILALMLATVIPMPWFAVVRMNHKNMKLLNLVKMNSEDRQALLANFLEQSVSILCGVYAVIDILSGNLFSHWG
jgi:hypothetical protein